jgi:GNAT superfamily N-acetyltransferase
MKILENAVTKPYWEPTLHFIVRHIHDEAVTKVGVSTWCIPGCGLGHRRYYVCMGHSEDGWGPVSWLLLRKRPRWKAWEVEQVWTFPQHRGKGLALRLYRAAIEHDGLTVASGRSHTKHSRAFWEKLVKKGIFKIWAQYPACSADPNPRKFKVDWCRMTASIKCAIPLYATRQYSDPKVARVRLFARKLK